MHSPAIEFLDEAFEADFERGVLIWRRRPMHHFAEARAGKLINTRFAGREVRGEVSKGYRLVRIRIGGKAVRLRIHRVIWALHYGSWPGELDHRDRDKQNNRISNLRLATRTRQMQNTAHAPPQTLLVGAYPNGSGFCSRISVDGQDRYLGQFATAEEASKAYLEAKKRLHG